MLKLFWIVVNFCIWDFFCKFANSLRTEKMKKRVFITGATGHMGWATIQEFMSRLDRLI